MSKFLNAMITLLNIVSAILIGIYVYQAIIGKINITDIVNLLTNVSIIIPVIILFLISHFLRIFRIYLLLMENRLPFREIIKIYLHSTLVNNILPFKTGEAYKALVYGKHLNDLSKGILIVWIDRFFDTVIMCLFSLSLILNGKFSTITVIMYIFVLVSIIIYTTFYNTYIYFNKLLLSSGQTKKSVLYLKILEGMHRMYEHAKELIRGRAIILAGLSLLIWLVEYLMIALIFRSFQISFTNLQFFNYLNQTFFIGKGVGIYVTIKVLSILILILLTIIFTAITKKGVRKK